MCHESVTHASTTVDPWQFGDEFIIERTLPSILESNEGAEHAANLNCDFESSCLWENNLQNDRGWELGIGQVDPNIIHDLTGSLHGPSKL